MPSSLIGLVLFAAFVLPGYVWTRVVETRRPRPNRSGLTEAADLVFTGLLATTAATIIVVSVGEMSFGQLLREGEVYLQSDLQLTLTSLLATIVLSTAGAGLLALAVFRRSDDIGRIRPGSTVWFDALTMTGTGKPIVEIHLKDGTRYWGALLSLSVDPDEEVPDIVLFPRLWIAEGDDEPREYRLDSVIVRGSEIRDVRVRHAAGASSNT